MDNQHPSSSSITPRRTANHDRTNPFTRRQVTFADTIVIHKGPCLQENPDIEIAKCWYTPQDDLRIKEDMKRTVQYMRSGCDESTHEGLCTRGLEHMRDKNVLQRLMHERKFLVEAVINEQLRLLEQQGNANTSRIISLISSRLSKRARDRALHVARLDAASVC